jgi:hypothetical protein
MESLCRDALVGGGCRSPSTLQNEKQNESGHRMRKVTGRRIALIRFLCGVGEQFGASGLYLHAINCEGHRFLKSAFKIEREGRNIPIYYCRCGQLAIRGSQDDDFAVLELNAAARRVGPCNLGD